MNNIAISPSRQYVAVCRNKHNGKNKLVHFHLPDEYNCDAFVGPLPKFLLPANCAGAAQVWFLNYGKDPDITTYAWGQPLEVDLVLPFEDIVDFMNARPTMIH